MQRLIIRRETDEQGKCRGSTEGGAEGGSAVLDPPKRKPPYLTPEGGAGYLFGRLVEEWFSHLAGQGFDPRYQ